LSSAVAVMYLGRIVEYAGSEEFFKRPLHPYSQSLISAIPRLTDAATEEVPPGEAPDPRRPPSGCRFHPRCLVGPTARPGRELCTQSDPQLDAGSRQHNAACHFVGPSAAKEAVG
jgi:peptide/nickel transport system ATP-binding protein